MSAAATSPVHSIVPSGFRLATPALPVPIAGSAGTVAITFLGLAFTNLGVFATVGPALSVTIAVGFAASVTLLPALIVLTGRRGWVRPRKDMTGRFWRKSGIQIARKPKSHLLVSLVILVALAGCTLLVKFNYDDRKTLPPDAPSNLGYQALDAHFPVSSTLQQFVLIQAPATDLRSPKALADLEQLAAPAVTPATGASTNGGVISPNAARTHWWPTSPSLGNSPAGAGHWQRCNRRSQILGGRR